VVAATTNSVSNTNTNNNNNSATANNNNITVTATNNNNTHTTNNNATNHSQSKKKRLNVNIINQIIKSSNESTDDIDPENMTFSVKEEWQNITEGIELSNDYVDQQCE
jgi:hypothetical protein